MNQGDFILQMQPSPRSQLEVITGESNPDQSQRRGGVTRLTVDVPSARASGETRPPRWRTPEFFFYYVVFLAVVPWMVYSPIQLSASASFSALASYHPDALSYSETHPNYNLYHHRLAKGWFPGTEIVSVYFLCLDLFRAVMLYMVAWSRSSALLRISKSRPVMLHRNRIQFSSIWSLYIHTIDTSHDAQIGSLTDTLSQDNSDGQYRSFRLNLPALGVLMAAFFALKYAYMRPVLRGSAPADNLHRIPFYILVSLLMLTILHGASILKVLFILAMNYVLGKMTGGTRLAIPATWLFNGGVLLANKWYEGYAFGNLHPGFEFLVSRRHLVLLWPNHGPDDLNRMVGVASTRVGMLASTSPCYAWSHLALIITGLVPGPVLQMYDTDSLARVRRIQRLHCNCSQVKQWVTRSARQCSTHSQRTPSATILRMFSTLRCILQGP